MLRRPARLALLCFALLLVALAAGAQVALELEAPAPAAEWLPALLSALLAQGIPGIVAGLLMIVGVCATLATVTPTSRDDAFFARAARVLHLLGGNFGQARNAPRDD